MNTCAILNTMFIPIQKITDGDCGTPSQLATYFKALVDIDQAIIRKKRPQPYDFDFRAFNLEQLQTALSMYNGWPNLLLASLPITREHFFVIVQHADHDVDFQDTTLKAWEKLPNLALPCNVAYLHDRVCSNKKTPQRYGTQGRNIDGVWRPFICESASIDVIDSLRYKVRIYPSENFDDNRLQEYYRLMNRHCSSSPPLTFMDYNLTAIAIAPPNQTCK